MTDDDFSALYTSMRAVVFRYAARRVGPERAKDIVAETFAVAWEKREDYPEDQAAWPAWTIGIARNKVLQDIQRRQRKHHDNRFIDDWLEPWAEPAVADSTDTVGDSDQARRVFAALTPAEQDLFALAFVRDLTPADGAMILNISVTAYTTRVGRLRQRLRSLQTPAPASDRRSMTS